MKIVAAVLAVLLIALLGGAGYFYLKVHQPMAADLAKFRSEQPQLEKNSRELKTRKDREAQETAWVAPTVDALRKGLAAAGIADNAEVAVAGNRVVVNIAEGVLYTPHSVTFAKDGKPALDGLADMLKPLKDLEIVIGNVTEAAPAQGKGRKRVPPKDARSLAAGRSVEVDAAVLTERERVVLRLPAQGRRTRDIAQDLGISAKTVETYRGRIMLKLGIENLAGLVRFAIRAGIAPGE